MQECIGAIRVHSPRRDRLGQTPEQEKALVAARKAVGDVAHFLKTEEMCVTKLSSPNPTPTSTVEKCNCARSRPIPDNIDFSDLHLGGDAEISDTEATCRWEAYPFSTHWTRGYICIAQPRNRSWYPHTNISIIRTSNDSKLAEVSSMMNFTGDQKRTT